MLSFRQAFIWPDVVHPHASSLGWWLEWLGGSSEVREQVKWWRPDTYGLGLAAPRLAWHFPKGGAGSKGLPPHCCLLRLRADGSTATKARATPGGGFQGIAHPPFPVDGSFTFWFVSGKGKEWAEFISVYYLKLRTARNERRWRCIGSDYGWNIQVRSG